MTRHMRMTLRNLALSLLVFCLTLLFLSPLYLVLINSGKTLGEIMSDVSALPAPWHWDNYVRAWENTNFTTSFLNSLIVTVASNLGVVLIASMAAYRLTRFQTRKNRFIYRFFLAGMILPFQVVMIPLTIIISRLGLTDNLFGVIFAYFGMAVPMGVFMYCGFIKGIPRDVEEAATIDGCSELQKFFKVVFPLLKPATFTLIILNTFWFWNDYLMPRLILSKKAVMTIPIAINTLMTQYVMQWDLALPAMVMAIIPAVIVFLLLQKNIVAGITAGAVKG